MRVNIKTRHIEVTDEIKQYANKKLQSIAEKSMPVLDASLSIDKVKHNFVVEIQISGKHIVFHAQDSNENLHTAVDRIVNKVQRQLRKSKEKIKSHKATHLGKLEAPDFSSALRADDDFGYIEPESFDIKPMYLYEAMLQMHENNRQMTLFINAETEQLNLLSREPNDQFKVIIINNDITKFSDIRLPMAIYKYEDIDPNSAHVPAMVIESSPIEQLTLGSAIKKFQDDLSKPYFLYVNLDSQRPNILFQKNNKTVGLVVPSFDLYHNK